jgi:peptidylprolyl isomerase
MSENQFDSGSRSSLSRREALKRGAIIGGVSWSLPVLQSLAAPAFAQTGAAPVDPENLLIVETTQGEVTIRLRPDIAPNHAERLRTLARQGFYDGVIFHRVIDGFMAQTGDPTGTGRGGSGQRLPAEFSNEPFERGTLGMARTQDPNSADSQFFIMFQPAPHLNGQYTVWGQVTEGMEHVDALARGEPPRNPDRIVQMRVAADADG